MAKKLLHVLRACLLTLLVAFVGAIAVACKKDKEEPPKPGAETGVYYCDVAGVEYLIDLHDVDQFTYYVNEKVYKGSYSVNGAQLTLDFNNDADGTATATVNGDILSVEYNNSTMNFWKKVLYTVQFQSHGGLVNSVSVLNGKTVEKPADPQRDGYLFLGWFTDSAFTTPFTFGTQIVTSNTTLYAKWEAKVGGQAEYVVSFDLGYADAVAPASVVTANGKLDSVPTVQRANYEFGGWWVSMYDKADKLSYAYEEDAVFTADTTLYALWKSTASTGAKLNAPVVSVKDTVVEWNGVVGANTYKLEISGPNGFTEVSENVGATSKAIDFAAAPAGDYVVRVTAIHSVEQNNSDATVRYYKNKALANVSSFRVVEPSTLVFNAVENAENYVIAIDCGNPMHKHTAFNNGNSTNYNFANCDMKEGGIKFTVTAEADGFAASTPRTYTYNRMLAQVSGLMVDEATQTVGWDAVPNATSYVVSVVCGDSSHVHQLVNNGNKTTFSLKDCVAHADGIKISVYPVSAGYNTPEASTITYNKTALPAPRNLRIVGDTLSWNAVVGATDYTVKVGNETFTAATNSFDLSTLENWVKGTDYVLSVKANGENSSLYSDALDARYYALYTTLKYADGTVSWRPVIGATSYEVAVNYETVKTVDDGSAQAAVVLTKAGNNVITVRFSDGETTSDWVNLIVYAYTIEFDTRGGKNVTPQYKAIGDKVELPETEYAGYEFKGWFNAPNGTKNNAKQYAEDFHVTNGGMVLYADWDDGKFTVTYIYGNGMGDKVTDTVTYNQAFKLVVPTPNDARFNFYGWFTAPGAPSEDQGTSVRLTNELGESVGVWTYKEDLTIYAYYAEALAFELLNDGTYSVTQGPQYKFMEHIFVPQTYKDKPVTVVEAYAFQAGTLSTNKIDGVDLRTVTIPNTIKIIENTAFYRCNYLEAVHITPVEGNRDVIYSSQDGVLIRYNEATGGLYELAVVPPAFTGEFVIPDLVTEIPLKTFAGSKITSIVIPASVEIVREKAFYQCSLLETVTFIEPERGETAQALTIEKNAFQLCSKLETVTFPARTQTLATDTTTGALSVFDRCPALENVHVTAGNATATYGSVNGMLTVKSAETAPLDTIAYCPTAKSNVEIPVGISQIGNYAFQKCTALGELSIPNYVTRVGNYAFAGANVTKLTFVGDGLNPVTVGNHAFDGCANLTDIVFSGVSKVNALGEYAFANCVKLEEFNVPASLALVGKYAFSGCTALSEIDFADNGVNLTFNEGVFSGCIGLTRVDLPSYVTNIDVSLFDGCDNLAGIYVNSANTKYADINGVLYEINAAKAPVKILFYSKLNGNITLPDTVTEIGASVFRNNKNITSFVVGKNVTKIGDHAFDGCTSLTGVTFTAVDAGSSNTLTLGSYAFANCTNANFTTVQFPKHATTIGAYVLSGSKNVSNISFLGDVTEIKNYAFQKTGITGITLPTTLKTLGDGVFAGSKLATLVIPNSVETMGAKIFQNCKSLTSVTLSTNTKFTEISDYAFQGSSIASLTLPDNVTEIGEYAFESSNLASTTENPFNFNKVTSVGGAAFSNTKVQTVVIPGAITFADGTTSVPGVFENTISLTSVTLTSVTAIADYMFQKTGLTSVTIPATVTNIGDHAFAYAPITTLTFTPDAQGATPAALTIEKYAFYRCGELTGVNLPDRVTKIDTYAFYYNQKLATFTISNTSKLTSIGASAFWGCSKLGSINIPKEVITVGNGAFCACTRLSSVTFQEGYEGTSTLTIDKTAFQNCTSLTSITLPKKLGKLTDYSVFSGCRRLETINVHADCAAFKSIDGIVYNKAGTEIVRCPVGKTGAVTIPNTVTAIQNSAFRLCMGITSVVFQEGNITNSLKLGTSSSGYAFQDCYSLQSVTLPQNREIIINGYAFSKCYSLSSINLGQANVTGKIGNQAFDYTALTSVTIPATVTELGNYVFRYVSTLTQVNFTDTAQTPSTITKIGNQAFRETGISSIVLPSSLTTLGTLVFQDCPNLTTVTLSKNTTAISTALQQVPALTTVNVADGSETFTSANGVLFSADGKTLMAYPASKKDTAYVVPSSVTAIGAGAFQGNTYLQTLTLPAGLVGTIGDSTFEGCTALTQVLTEGKTGNRLPDGVTAIGTYAFKDTGIQSLVLHDGLKTIGAGAFAGSALTSITIPESVTEIKTDELANDSNFGTFEGCTALTTAVILAKVTDLPEEMFNNSGLQTVSFPTSVTAIHDSAFANTSLTSLPPLGTVTILGRNAFKNTNITETYIPESVEQMGYYRSFSSGKVYKEYSNSGNVFEGVQVTEFEVATNNTDYLVQDGVLYTSDMKTLMAYPAGRTDETFTIPESVTTLNQGAFAGAKHLKSMVIPSLITAIPDYTFDGCTQLAEITMPDGITKIGKYAFRGTAITEVTISKSTDTIAEGAFYGCESLAKVNGFENVTVVNSYAFFGCKALTSLTFSKSIGYIQPYAFSGTGLTSVTIDTSYSGLRFSESSFANCLSLQTVNIKAASVWGTSNYGYSAFEGCVNLQTASLSGWTTIYENMFKDCTSLSTFVLGDEVKTIQKGAFENCTSLNNFVVTFAVATIQEGAFRGWTSAQTITVIGLDSAPLDWTVNNWNDGCNAVVDWDDGDDE